MKDSKLLQKTFLLVGMGQTNQALSSALLAKGGTVIAADDAEVDDTSYTELGVEFYSQPTQEEYAHLGKIVDYCVPTPGTPDSHPIYSTLKSPKKFLSELDIASSLTEVPVVAITGTNGKSTVVALVRDSLVASGIEAIACGNSEIPFTKAILENPNCQTFVVEASSFGLRHTKSFNPKVAAWLNFSPNHLDIHTSLKHYENAKAKIWARISDSDIWVANRGDPVVWGNRPRRGEARIFGDIENLETTSSKLSNENAATLIASAAGASRKAIEESITNFAGLPHRMQKVTTIDDISWFNDSKATTPHAVKAGISEMGQSILIAGGRDKSGALSELRQLSNICALIAIGESSEELRANFSGICPFGIALDMKQAVLMAYGFAQHNNKELGIESVILSPGASSFDWYKSYKERGDDFMREVKDLEKCLRG